MSRSARGFAALAALLLAMATIAGALSAHVLQAQLSPGQYGILQTAVSYQFFHSLGLLAVALWLDRVPAAALRTAAWLLSIGIVLFSGSLYGLLSGLTGALGLAIGVLTPLGGLALIVAWLLVAVVLVVSRARPSRSDAPHR
jgi:uncharacterized membrane protein YgdD (TMEM256/DUF423 family)